MFLVQTIKIRLTSDKCDRVFWFIYWMTDIGVLLIKVAYSHFTLKMYALSELKSFVHVDVINL